MRKSIIFLVFLFCFTMIPLKIVMGDIGPKPTITIYAKGYKNKNYYLDLLVKEPSKYQDNNEKLNRNLPESFRESSLYKYNVDGWKALYIRNSLLFGSLKGKYDEKKDAMVHRFSYVAVPDTFKIIVQYEDGTTVVSNELTPKQFNAKVSFDLLTQKANTAHDNILENFKDSFLYKRWKGTASSSVLFGALLTILIELGTAFVFRIKAVKVIVGANIITQILLLMILLLGFISPQYYILMLALGEILVVLVEYIIYIYNIKSVTKNKILIYTITANLLSFGAGFLLKY